MRRGKKPKWQVEIAKERMSILFSLAKKELGKHPERSRRYIELAKKIGLRYNIRLSRELKRGFCKNCNTLLVSGKTCINRLDSAKKTINIICKNCGNIIRIPYKVKEDDREHKH
jgi:ribonuclease P protein subunit RPR2